MSVHVLRPPAPPAWLQTTDDLVEALGVPFSDQQLEAITAPLEPGVIIAGAGSGKTTVMAARVVWLVGTGAVRPEQVLGLTFTRKAAAELSERIRAALVRMDEGVFGVCDECGEEIGVPRLKARPVTKLCINCKSKQEEDEHLRGE